MAFLNVINILYATYNNGAVATSNTAKFIYSDSGELQGFILNNSATYLYTKNLQGDITSIVNESGSTILNYTYDAWGTVSFVATSMNNMLLAYTLSYVSPFTYRGYCYDYDIELYYLQSRYYSADIGRFINTDDTSIAIQTQGEILGANLFAYCCNNPTNGIDPTGNWVVSLVGLGYSIYVGWGTSFTLQWVYDNHGNHGILVTVGAGFGLDVSASYYLGFSWRNTIYDLEGTCYSFSGGFSFGKISIALNLYFDTRGLAGINIGVGLGFLIPRISGNASFCVAFIIPINSRMRSIPSQYQARMMLQRKVRSCYMHLTEFRLKRNIRGGFYR